MYTVQICAYTHFVQMHVHTLCANIQIVTQSHEYIHIAYTCIHTSEHMHTCMHV
jgi:hypothetical protein